jgi:hypothetical protein
MTDPWRTPRPWRGGKTEYPEFKSKEVLNISADRTMWRYDIEKDKWVQCYVVDL